MKNKLWPYLVGLGVVFVAIAVAASFVNRWAPLILLASVAIQLPIVLVIFKTTLNGGYRDRDYERRRQYEKDGDAEAWLAAEENEARAVGYRYWSENGRALNALNRADALAALGRRDEAAQALADCPQDKLDKNAHIRYDDVLARIRAAAPGGAPAGADTPN